MKGLSKGRYDETFAGEDDRSLDISAHNNFGPCQFRPITKSAYTISMFESNFSHYSTNYSSIRSAPLSSG